MKQQITSFTHLLSKVRSGGLYVIEDLYTSYKQVMGGGYLVRTTTIELIKRLIDDIHTDSPSRKSATLAEKLFSFEISNKICFFNIK
jgi:demethylmacrocin O-methyltransferase